MPKPWNEEVYFVQTTSRNYGGAGCYGWGNTILEALQNTKASGAQSGDPYILIKIKGDFTVSHFDGSISYTENGWLKALTSKDQPRAFPKSMRKEAAALERLVAV